MTEDITSKKKVYDITNPAQNAKLLQLLRTQQETSGTTLISLFYQKMDDNIFRLVDKQSHEHMSIKDKKTRNLVESGLTTLKNILRSLYIQKEFDRTRPGAIFAKGDFGVVAMLPSNIKKNLYKCGKKFLLEGLEPSSGPTWGLVTLDTKMFSIGLYKNNEIIVLHEEPVNWIPNRNRAGGQSSNRFALSRALLVSFLAEKVSNLCNSYFQNQKIEKILVGGVIPTSTVFHVQNKLLPELKSVLSEVTSTVYCDRYGLHQLLEKNMSKYQEHLKQYLKQKEQYQELFVRVSKNKVFERELLLASNDIQSPNGLYVRNTVTIQDWYCSQCRKLTSSRPECGESHSPHFVSMKPEFKVITYDPKSIHGSLFEEYMRSKRTQVLYYY